MSTPTPSAHNPSHDSGRGGGEVRNRAETGSAPVPSRRSARRLPPLGPVSEEPGEDAPERAPLPGQDTNLALRKFRDRLPFPSVIRAWVRPEIDALPIRAERATVRHHADLPPTEAWTYNGELPGPTIEVRSHEPVLIDWANELVDDDPHPHRGGDPQAGDDPHREHHARGVRHPGHDPSASAPLPYDVVRVPPQEEVIDTVAKANEPGGRVHEDHGGHRLGGGEGGEHAMQRQHDTPEDSYPRLDGTDAVRAATVVHLHGALTDGHNDGWAHNVMAPGHTARCTYPNAQEACTLWYHDHAMAVTRFNVHAGLAGFYLVRDQNEDALTLPAGDHELPLLIADRNIESADTAEFRPTGRLLYKQAGVGEGDDAAQIAVSGPFTSVNGKIWPTHPVEARWHRLRLLNASNARIYRLALYDTTDENVPLDLEDPLQATPEEGFGPDPERYGVVRLPQALVAIGTEGGFLPEPMVPANGVIQLGPGERMDVLVDFSTLRGRTVELRNENATHLHAQVGQVEPTVMQFTVGERAVDDPFELPVALNPGYNRWRKEDDGTLVVGPDPERDRIEDYRHVWIGVIPQGTLGDGGHPQMWELEDVSDLPEDEIGGTEVIRLTQPGGKDAVVLRAAAKLFDDTVTIQLAEDDWALWHIVHLGGPDHPMHIHMTTFQMLERRAWEIPEDAPAVPGFDLETGSTPEPLPVPGPGPEIDPIAAGTKETWVVRPGELVTVLGHFAGANGSFMYHCHILDHEDHTMMRPFVVLPESLLALHADHGGGHH